MAKIAVQKITYLLIRIYNINEYSNDRFFAPLSILSFPRYTAVIMTDLDRLLTYEGKPIPPKKPRRQKKRLYVRMEELEADDQFLEKLKRLAAAYCPHAEMAAYFDVSIGTWNAFRKKHPELDQLIEDYAAKSLVPIRGKMFQKAQAGDFQAMKYVLEVKGGWTTKEKSLTINVPVAPRPEDIPDNLGDDPNEAAKIYQKLMG